MMHENTHHKVEWYTSTIAEQRDGLQRECGKMLLDDVLSKVREVRATFKSRRPSGCPTYSTMWQSILFVNEIVINLPVSIVTITVGS